MSQRDWDTNLAPASSMSCGKQYDLHSKGLGIVYSSRCVFKFKNSKLGGDPGDWVCMDHFKCSCSKAVIDFNST